MRCFSLMFMLILGVSCVFAQEGKVIEGNFLISKILQQKVNYSVYLPADYESSTRSYPIVYLLHGYTDDETAWVQFGKVHKVLDEGIKLGELPEMIVVMPDAGVTWYIDAENESNPQYETMFIEEFMPHIESTFRVRKKKEFRGITGLSMGGYGSLIYAMKYPDLFAACAPLSAAIYTEEEVLGHGQERWDEVEGILYKKGLKGNERISTHWKKNNPFYMLEELPIENIKTVQYYFDIGDEDFLLNGNLEFHKALNKKGIPHELRIRDGEHNWTYWRTGILDALKFISKRFTR